MLENLARASHLAPSVFYTIVFGILIFAALVVGFALNRFIHHWTKKFRGTWGELIFSLFEALPIPLLVLTAIYVGLESLRLPHRYDVIGSKVILALVLLVIFYFPAKVVILFLRRLSQKNPAMERITQPASFVVRALFALLATIIFLENLGVSLTAVWTTLGVGSVAVALALQETLSNFFSGLYLLVDQPIAVGDYIKLDSGQEGYVVRIGWRSTVLRTLPANLVVIPNSTLAKAVITNYSEPELRMAYVMPVSVTYGTDPERVEKALMEVVEEALRDGLEGLLPSPAPFVRFAPGFGDSSLDFSLIVQVRQFTDQFAVQSALRKRIVKKFQAIGIEMPFPTRTLVLAKSSAESLRAAKPDPQKA